MQLDRYIYTICIVHIDKLRKSAQVIYVAVVGTCAVRIYRRPVFSRCCSKGYPTTDFIGRIQDITDYLSHLPETQVNRAYSQNISVVKNGNFMRNKGHVLCVCVCVRPFTDSKNILTTYHIFAPKIRRPIFFNFPGRGQPLFSNFHSMGPPIIKKRCCRPRGGREHFWNSPKLKLSDI